VEGRPPSSDFVDQVLDALKSADSSTRKRALGRLKDARPTDRATEVAAAVEPILSDPDGFTRADAAAALAVWGGPENTPALVEALKDPAFNVRWAVLDALKVLADPKSAPAIAEFLTSRDRGKACEALKAIGPRAEESVIPYLKEADTFVRMDTCKVLQVIGTEKSVPALREIAARNSGLDSMAARNALKEMSLRRVNINVKVTSPRKKRPGR
jgi:HEAT repeat protein